MAGNARFHDKLHRKNHHTNPTVGFADSASDPIASPSEPFQGDFVINGKLSSSSGIQVLSANFEKDVYCNNIHVSSVTYTNWISGNSTETIISDGALTGHGNNTLTLDYGKAIYNKVNNNTIMYMNSSNVGIGTANPISRLHVDGDITVSNGRYLNLDTNTGGGFTAIRRNTGQNGMEFFTQSASRMFISDTNGNVGIGTTTPTEKLHVDGNVLITGNLSALGGTTQFDTTIVTTSAMIIDTLGTTDALRVTQRGTGNAILVEDDTNPDSSAFVVNSAGNVGIGTITPRSKLDMGANVIAGVSNIRGHSNSGAYSIWGGLGSDASIDGGYIQLYGSAHSTNPHLLVLGNSNAGTRVAITSGGNVGIGTTTPNSTLHVNGHLTLPNKTLQGSISGSTNGAVNIAGGNDFLNGTGGAIAVRGLTNGFNNGGMEFYYGNGTSTIEAMRIVSGGKVGIGTDIPSGTLDVTANTTGAALFISQLNIDGYALLVQDNGGINKPFVIKNRGFVGIGTLSPNKELTIYGDISANGFIYSKDIYLNRGDTQREGGQINFARSFDNATQFAIDTYTDNIGSLSSRLRFIDVSSNAERMTMLSSGNVGIGTANPISKLHVDGDITVSNGRYLNLDTNTGGGFTAIRRNTGENGMEFFTQSASRMFISDTNGNVGIGTKIPNKQLTVVGDISATGTLYTDSSSYSLSSNGYTKLPNGIIMQWGNTTCSNTGETNQIYPIKFPNQFFNIVTTPVNGTGSTANYSMVGTCDLSSFNVSVYDISGNRVTQVVFWQAMGY